MFGLGVSVGGCQLLRLPHRHCRRSSSFCSAIGTWITSSVSESSTTTRPVHTWNAGICRRFTSFLMRSQSSTVTRSWSVRMSVDWRSPSSGTRREATDSHVSLNSNSFMVVEMVVDNVTGGPSGSLSSSLPVSLRRHPHVLAFPFSESPHVLRQVMIAAESDRAKSHNKLRISYLH